MNRFFLAFTAPQVHLGDPQRIHHALRIASSTATRVLVTVHIRKDR